MADSIRTIAAPLPLSMMLRLRGVHLDDDTESGGGGAAVSDDERGSAREDDASTSFIDRMAAKYDKEDQADADAEDDLDASADDDDAEEDQRGAGKAKDKDKKAKGSKAVAADDDDETVEHPDDDEESDSAADDDAEHPDDAEDDEAPEDSDDDEVIDDEDDDDEEDEVSAETKAALEGRGADLKLSDVPEEYRPIVQKKLREVDAAFTKVMQEGTAFRSERTKLMAENKFREDNPEIVVIELLEKNPDLFDKVNAQLAKNEDQTVAEAFKIVVEKKRNTALKAIEDETQGAERHEARISEIEGLTEKHASAHGIPAWIADQAVGNAINAAFSEKRLITNPEIKAAVDAIAKQYKAEHRGEERKKSKEKIKARTEQRRQAPPAVKKPGSAASPGASSGKKGAKVDWNNETSRQSRILESARRIMPGAR